MNEHSDETADSAEEDAFARALESHHMHMIAPTAAVQDSENLDVPAAWMRARAALPVLELLHELKEAFKTTSSTGNLPNQVLADTVLTKQPSKSIGSRQAVGKGQQQIGRFEILEQIGRGGFGIVLRAFDPRLGREVALKVPRLESVLFSDARQRFLREMSAAAGLNHPHIVTVHEVGSDGGIDFLVTEYIDGCDLAHLIALGYRYSIHDCARLMIDLAGAVQCAHDRGVLHRDIKPANILTRHEDPTNVKITDFGLALCEENPELTNSSALLGTPAFMAPEQTAGDRRHIGPQTDVYGLGTVLYQLLTGVPPFSGRSILETIRKIAESEPTAPRSLRGDCPKPLEAICLKCLNKAPDRRYASARELADDLHRFVHGQPVTAHSTSAVTHAWRWCRRHPVATLVAIFAATLAVFGPAIAVVQSRLHHAANRAHEQAQRVLYLSDMNLAYRDWYEANVGRCGELLQRHVPQPGQPDYRGFEWFHLSHQWQQTRQCELVFHDEGLESAGLSPDESTLVIGTFDGSVAVIDVATRVERARWQAHPYRTCDIAFSSDGRLLATASVDNEVKLWEIASGRLLAQVEGSRSVDLSPDGTLAFRSANMQLGLLPPSDANPSTEQRPQPIVYTESSHVGAVAYAPDGGLIAVAGWDHTLSIWDVPSRSLKQRLAGHDHALWCIDWSSDGKLIAAGDVYGRVRIWDAKNGSLIANISAHSSVVKAIRLADHSRFVVTCSSDATARVWELPTGKLLRALPGHRGEVSNVMIAAGGDQIFTAGSDGDVKRWQFGDRPNNLIIDHPQAVSSISFSLDGQRIITGCADGYLRVFESATCTELSATKAHKSKCWRVVCLDYDGRECLVTSGDDASLRIWDLESMQLVRELPGRGNANDPPPIAVSANGVLLAFQDSDFSVQVIDLRANNTLCQLIIGKTEDLTFDPTGTVLFTASDAKVAAWDIEAGRQRGEIHVDSRQVNAIAVSVDGRSLLSASFDRTLKSWPIDVNLPDPFVSHQPRQVIKGSAGPVNDVVFSRDGQTLVSCGDDRMVRIWDTVSGQQRAALQGHAAEVVAIAFAPDGQTLASAGNDTVLRLWPAPRGQSNSNPTNVLRSNPL